MNKALTAIISVILVLGLTLGGCAQSADSNLQFQNFEEVLEDYQLIAHVCLYYFDIYSPSSGMTVLPQGSYMDYYEGNDILRLSEIHIAAIKTIRDTLGDDCYFWVTEDSVVFWQDKTRQYGLLYSGTPAATIREMTDNGYEGLESHRINNNWYEIGYFATQESSLGGQ